MSMPNHQVVRASGGGCCCCSGGRYLLQLQLDDLLLVGVGLVLPLHVALPALLLRAAATPRTKTGHDIPHSHMGSVVGGASMLTAA